MRILVPSNLFPPDILGGYELLLKDVVESLRRRGHDVAVLTTGQLRAEDPSYVHRLLTLVRPFDEPGRIDRLRHLRAAREQRAIAEDFLASERPFDAILFGSLRRLGLHLARTFAAREIPGVWLFNDDWLLAHRPDLSRHRIRNIVTGVVERGPLGVRTWRGVSFDRAVYPSAAIRDALLAGGAPVPSGVVRYQGTDRRAFPSRGPRPVPLAPTLMFAGRLHPTKGCDVAIDTLARLRSRGVDAKLLIAGRGAPDYEQSLRDHAAAKDVSSSIEWRGFLKRDELSAAYRRADVFVFPSLWEEPAGLTYLEAMSSGTPVVAIARGGARELLVDRENALIADDAEGLAKGVEALMADATLAAKLSQGGEALVEKSASLEGYVDAIEGELLAIAGTRAA